jgi:hypothetical protein
MHTLDALAQCLKRIRAAENPACSGPESFDHEVAFERIQQDNDARIAIAAMYFAHEPQTFDGIGSETWADQHDVEWGTGKLVEDILGRGSGDGIAGPAAQECVHQQLAAHADAVGHQDASNQVRIGNGCQGDSDSFQGASAVSLPRIHPLSQGVLGL